MPDSTFVQWQQTALYLADGATPATARSAVLLRDGAAATNPLTLAQSLANAGAVYLLFPVLPYNAADASVLNNFLAAVQSYLLQTSQRSTRVLWISNPLTVTQGVQATSLPVTLQGSTPIVGTGTFIPLAPNVSVLLGGGTQISVSQDSTALVFTASTSAANSLIVTPSGTSDQQRLALTGPTTLTFFGTSLPAGCLGIEFAPDLTGLSYLGAGLRYYTTDLNPDDPAGYLLPLPYPIFALEAASTLALYGVVDPLAPLDATRTYFQFGTAAALTTTPLPTYFRSGLNAPVTLTPQASARFIFAIDTIVQTENGQPDPNDPYYLAPAGDFTVALATQSGQFANHLLCGFSGVEYFNLANNSGTLSFMPGQPAFAPATQQTDPQDNTQTRLLYQQLTGQAVTSWAYLKDSETYFAQPDSSVLHQPDAAHPAFLNYLPVQAGQLTPPIAPSRATDNTPKQAFPLVPYAGVALKAGLDYQGYETQVLNPTRRSSIYNINPAFGAPRALAAAATTTQGTTPQGLLLQLDGNDWDSLTLAQTPDGGTGSPVSPLALSNVRGALKGALQTNQLFAVVSSGSKLLENADITNYKLTVQSWTDLEQSQNPVVPANILTKLKPLQNVAYSSLTDYQTALQTTLGADYATYANLLVQVGASFGVTIQSWRFDLSPYFWSSFNTLLIFKFINTPFVNLVENTSAWAQAVKLNDDPASTQQSLLKFIQDVEQSDDPNLAYFRDTVLGDPNWNGILALRCRVPLSGLPPEIEGLAAGIDPSQFFAHHIGITVTPVQIVNNQLTQQNSTLFGLIRYSDPSHLNDTNTDYQFKVQTLDVQFVNSEVSNFASQIELLINRLFAEPVQLVGSNIGNNIQLDGVYQKHGDSGSYVFQNQQTNVFNVTSRVLDQVIINQAQFVTRIPPANLDTGDKVQTQFLFTGNLAFQALKGFDIFSFGTTDNSGAGLAFSNLAVDLSFPPDTPSYKTFSFNAQQIAFNPALSVARPLSLFPRFPLKLTGLLQATGQQTPANLNYMPVDSPVPGSQLKGVWFGLVFDLNLGSLGALASQAGFIASLLLGWQANTSQPTVYIGLQIPGAKGGKREISLEGIIKLKFGDLRFVVEKPGAYILQIRNIALSVLSLSFPPGQTDILLFGDPSGTDNSTLGWYAAYKKANQGGGSGGKSAPRLLAPRS